jgi:hypothetical protein
VKLKRIDTSNAQGDTGGRLTPDGGTRFVITGKKEFPTVPLRVVFKQGDLSVPVEIGLDSASRPDPKQLAGTAPVNSLFVGDAAIYVYADNGETKISKKTLCDDTGCSVYYSFDPPTPPTSINVPGFNRLGGNLTITAANGGFRRFDSSIPGVAPIPPSVKIGEIDFAVNLVLVTSTTINGNVQRAGPDIPSCVVVGHTPCKRISVKNPGGRNVDKAKSAVELYNLMAGPPPSPASLTNNSGQSTGGTGTRIDGDDLDFVDRITFNGKPGVIDEASRTRTRIRVTTPSNCPGTFPLVFKGIDRLDATLNSFTYLNTLSGASALDGATLSVALGGTAFSVNYPIIVGPCEVLQIPNADQFGSSGGCLRVSLRNRPLIELGGVRTYPLFLDVDATNCNVIAARGTFRFTFNLTNGPRTEPVRVDITVQ